MTSQKSQWRQAAVYQIYPWTFNEDKGRSPQRGHGSIKGITEKLDYLKNDVGVDAIWMSPFYPSPMKDAGYDIANLVDVDPALGTLEDFDELVATAHQHGIRLMVDFIPNHTSDQHEWFQKSRRREGYDDWYIWHPGIIDENGNRQVPNNWPCVFSMPQRQARDRGEMPWLQPHEWTPPLSQWEWDDIRQEYYLHSFAKEQPDLNWSNPFVRAAMKDAMRFWLDKGVDGFRVDAINHTGKNMEFPNEEVNTAYNEEWYDNPYDELLRYDSANYPIALHTYVWEMCQVLKDEKYKERDLRMVLEAYMGESDLRDLDAVSPSVASTFNFGALHLDWNAQHHQIQANYYYERLQKTAVGNQVNGNHDKPRVASRLSDDRARVAAVKNLFLPGMRFVYNGEELGLHNADVPEDRMQDPNGLRDNFRTPMIWNDEQVNGGFSNADPQSLWLPANDNDMSLSVNKQKNDPLSSLSLYREAMKLCRELPVVQHGNYFAQSTDNENIMAYARSFEDSALIVICNFSQDEQYVKIADSTFVLGNIILSSVTVRTEQNQIDLRFGVTLKPNEAIVVVPA